MFNDQFDIPSSPSSSSDSGRVRENNENIENLLIAQVRENMFVKEVSSIIKQYKAQGRSDLIISFLSEVKIDFTQKVAMRALEIHHDLWLYVAAQETNPQTRAVYLKNCAKLSAAYNQFFPNTPSMYFSMQANEVFVYMLYNILPPKDYFLSKYISSDKFQLPDSASKKANASFLMYLYLISDEKDQNQDKEFFKNEIIKMIMASQK